MMGYRSDVAYTIRFVHEDDTNNKQSFYTFLAEAKANAATAACFKDLDWAALEVDEAKFRINFHVDHVKWYEGYPDVQCHEALLSLAKEWDEDEDNHSHIAYAFVRMGEESDDIDERVSESADWDWVRVERTISRDW
jgi:hypothetical protein